MRDKQMELEIGSLKRQLVRNCQCKKTRETLVILQPSLDPRYFVGSCRNCKRILVERISKGS